MPVASNISEIRAVDDAVDTALAAQLEAYGVDGYQPRKTEDVPDLFSICMFTLGEAKHLHRTPLGGLEFDLWQGCLVSVELFCPRIVDANTAHGVDVIVGVYDLLGAMAVRARHAFTPDRLGQLNDRLGFHHLTRFYPLPDVRGFDDERKLDRHELRWRTDCGVLRDAWPTDPAAYVLPARP